MTLSPSDLHDAFVRVADKAAKRTAVPHQSTGINVKFPGAYLAAEELGVSRSHLHRVLTGERESQTLISRWQGWLKRHPQFSALQAHK